MISYPVAEYFESIQGEGVQSGVAMTFLRLAGCTVGRPYTPAARAMLGLEVYQERCKDWAGESFACDTNYRMSKKLTIPEILELPEIKNAFWVSITGGEPLMHDITPLVAALDFDNLGVHIETSGTIAWARPVTAHAMHVVVSPKFGVLDSMLDDADEIRVVVGDSFNEEEFLEKYNQYIIKQKVWLSPINLLTEINRDNLVRCKLLQAKHRDIKITTQMHKIWGVR